ncbi:MAG: ribonuclease III [Spirochaetota bacterium]|jgi:ribonuclease-3|nr:ribonuclease III [Spirochaetota bacterium]
MNDRLRKAAEHFGLSFKNDALLDEALTHRSYANEAGIDFDNEKLEFFGDAVLGFLAAEYVYKEYPRNDEGLLSRLKSAVISERSLAEAALALDLGTYIRFGKGEQVSGGAERVSNLANAFEALLGAIYLDAGMDRARDFILEQLHDVLASGLDAEKPFSPRTELQEYVQKTWHKFPEYRCVSQTQTNKNNEFLFVYEVLVNGEIWGKGDGHSKKEACRNAAHDALSRLDNNE